MRRLYASVTEYCHIEEVDACDLATDNGSGAAAAGWLLLQFSVGIDYNARSVIGASPNGEDGIWGTTSWRS